MNIKSLLIGSAAALVAVSGAQAADAIVAAEPEAVEYVKVCDAFGTGYFYIPGTETCLKIGGWVRVQGDFGRDSDGVSDFSAWARARINFTAKNDTEYGALTSMIEFDGTVDEYDNNAGSRGNRGPAIRQAYIDLAGFRAGYIVHWLDTDLSGETDTLSGQVEFASLSYTYTGDAFTFGVSLDELEHQTGGNNRYTVANVGADGFDLGISALLSGAFGPVKAALVGGYDVEAEEGMARLIVTADVGPGTLGLAGIWASGVNEYYYTSKWAIAGEYAFKATDKLTLTPGVQYFGDLRGGSAFGNAAVSPRTSFGNNDGWRAGLTVDYKIVSGLTTKVSLQYQDADNALKNSAWDNAFSGFVRLERKF